MCKRLFIGLFVIGLCATLFGYQIIVRSLHSTLPIASEGLIYELERGSSLTATVKDLAQRKVIEDPRILLLYAKLTGRGNRILPGEYLLEPSMTPFSLIQLFEAGKIIQYSITFPEGWHYRQLIQHLQAEDKLEKKITNSSPKTVFETLQLKAAKENPEGLFFPSTYQYHKGMSDIDILKMANVKMMSVLDVEWQGRAKGLPFKTPYEALVLASIVEKETAVANERQQIAGVFIRRLKKNMRLQTDPTVIYGLGDQYKGNLTRKHLKQYTPYNTYRINGLPPTPIALPGREAIHAVLHPAEGNSYYFVARGDGSHYFSATITEHNKAVKRFQVHRRANNYRSTPEKKP